MPCYSYECSYCNEIFEANHSMSENYSGSSCPKCNKENALDKLPSYFTKFYKTDGTARIQRKVGDIVKEAINELTEDLYNYEEQLQEEIYEDGDNN